MRERKNREIQSWSPTERIGGQRLKTKLRSNFGIDFRGKSTKNRLRMQLTCDASAGTDLVLPLSGHNLGVGSGDLDTGVCHGLVGIQLETSVEYGVCHLHKQAL